jgi:hypothetical protein
MTDSRRDALKQLTYAGAGLAFGGGIISGRLAPIVVNGRPVEIVVCPFRHLPFGSP